MTLPYPYEVEIGRLKPRPRFRLRAFDVERHMREAIHGNGETVELFGVEYPLAGRGAEELLERLRSELTTRFEERVATPNDEVWQEFAERARAQLERHARSSDDIIGTLLATIDGL